MKKTLLLLVLALTALLGKAAVGDVFTTENLRFKILADPTETEYGKVELLGFMQDYHPQSLSVNYLYKYNDDSYRVNDIKSYAFYDEQYLQSVFIGFGVEVIGECAFYNCSRLSTVRLPSSIKTINNNAFVKCPSLLNVYYSMLWTAPDEVSGEIFDSTMKSVTLNTYCVKHLGVKEKLESHPNFHNVQNYFSDNQIYDFYDNDGSIYFVSDFPTKTKKGGLMLLGINTKINSGVYIHNPSYAISNSFELRQVKSDICSQNQDIKKVDLSRATNLNYIGERAFMQCTNLTEVITNLNGYIGMHAFSGCTSLRAADIKCGYIKYRAFFDCPLDQSFVLREGLHEIENEAFARESRRSDPTFTSITIPASVEKLHPFCVNNTNCEEFIVDPDNKTFASYNGLLYYKDFDYLCMCPPMGNPAALHPNTKKINGKAFYENPRISSIVLPYGTTHVYMDAFSGSSLTSIQIPSSVQYIDSIAFQNCNSLTTVRCNLPTEKVFKKPEGYSLFNTCANLTSFYVPYASLSDYKDGKWNYTSGNVPNFYNSAGDFIGDTMRRRISFGTTGYMYANGYYDVIDNTPFVENDDQYYGKVRLAYHETFPISGPVLLNVPTQVTLPNTDKAYKVVSVGSEVMGAHNYDNTSALQFTSTSVDTIADYAFKGQIMLQSVNIGGDQTKTIGKLAFKNCKNLTELMIQGDEITTGSNFYGSNASGFKCYVKWNQVGKTLNSISNWDFLDLTTPENRLSAYYKDSLEVNAISVSIPIDWTDSNLDVYAYNGVILGSKTVKTTKVVASKAGKGLIVANVVPDSIYRLTRLTNPIVEEEATDLIIGNPDEDTKASVYAKLNNKVFTFNQDEAVFEPATSSSIVKAGTAFLLLPYSNKTELNMITGKWKLDFYDYTKPGDVNGDGVIDIVDVNAIISDVINGADYNSQHDANKDGVVDVTDINYIVNIMLGL